ncbi:MULTISPECIES: Gfo/Idh/MocA family oxidoreductase [Arthrobacter]|uniref:Gfo/Idh/MocA family oxidoreductase n=1 Tax=Arthrobacter terricola TaxID=2547396 RepID=A0A4R5KVW5_9MICC|nr:MULTISPECIES: Gfo/Idh/MocA family oxidoreductase [Arthrobacter]MBT8159759.1 Gfo/Idh/MocA family oxidoreductase [Arthrobacter sp. GN70]TDF99137.1 gfo/Idh/MocA family oxidoreductase [Arthrobacter terricola]
MALRVGLVGYGAGGRYFHTPFIQASARCELVGVVTRSAERARIVGEDVPDVAVYGTLGELIDAGVDVVVISTPPETRQELVLEAIGRGVHVVADKPFAPSAEVGQELVEAAASAGVLLGVFHNRRWDTDLRTLRDVVERGSIGNVWRFDSRFDLDEPGSLEAGAGGGLLRDLGSHLVDQALHLFGPAEWVSAQLDWVDLEDGRTDAGFVINIGHRGGVHSHVSASKVNRLTSKELRVLGEQGSYESCYTDVQTQAIFAGQRPAENREEWGYETSDHWGTLRTAEGSRTIPSLQGDYTDYYDGLAAAIEDGTPLPVPAEQAIETLRVLDAARNSDAHKETVKLGR